MGRRSSGWKRWGTSDDDDDARQEPSNLSGWQEMRLGMGECERRVESMEMFFESARRLRFGAEETARMVEARKQEQQAALRMAKVSSGRTWWLLLLWSLWLFLLLLWWW